MRCLNRHAPCCLEAWAPKASCVNRRARQFRATDCLPTQRAEVHYGASAWPATESSLRQCPRGALCSPHLLLAVTAHSLPSLRPRQAAGQSCRLNPDHSRGRANSTAAPPAKQRRRWQPPCAGRWLACRHSNSAGNMGVPKRLVSSRPIHVGFSAAACRRQRGRGQRRWPAPLAVPARGIVRPACSPRQLGQAEVRLSARGCVQRAASGPGRYPGCLAA